MRGMKTSVKASLLVVVALALLACLAWLVSPPDVPVGASVSGTSRGPSFDVRVVKPRLARPLFGLIPEALFKSTDYGGQQRFDHTSRGAEIGSVGHDRLELRAEGWHLSVEIDGEGRVAPGTHLVFPLELAGRQRSLRCRPAERAVGYLRTAKRADSDVLDGSFLVELAACKNDESGKAIGWPPSPLTVRGSFEGLPPGRR